MQGALSGLEPGTYHVLTIELRHTPKNYRKVQKVQKGPDSKLLLA
jgi:hypothetical protein